MNRLRYIALLLAVATLLPASASAESTVKPFDTILNLVEWFKELNDDFDKVVIAEKKGQLARAVNRLRKNLYTLEDDTKMVKENIPDESPNASQKEHLLRLDDDLMASVARLRQSVRQIAADLRLDQTPILELAAIGQLDLEAKGDELEDLRKVIVQEPWDAEHARTLLNNGIQSVRLAQEAVTTFGQKLVSEQ